MKALKYVFFVLIISMLSSCSDDGTGSSGLSGNNYFEYTIDGQPVNVVSWDAQRSENTMMVIGLAADGTAMELNFNQFGDMGAIWAYNINTVEQNKRNHYFFKEHYFNFELVAIDYQVRKVQVAFSGDLYNDAYNLESERSHIEGSFLVNFQDVTPIIPGLKVSADIDGAPWYATEQYQQNVNSQSFSFISDDEYMLSFLVSQEATTVGNNTFNELSTYNKVVISRYNPEGQGLEQYVSESGTLNITNQTATVIEGNFTLNAKNPTTGEIITVTNGQFKSLYH
ncbi:MAG: hypothetical protein V4581_01770 [Bacteroidota bacterium]